MDTQERLFNKVDEEYEKAEKEGTLTEETREGFNNRIMNILPRGIDCSIFDVNKLKGTKEYYEMSKNSPQPHYFERMSSSDMSL